MAGLGAAVLLGIASAWGQTDSHVRIVRLSFVEGTVTVQRPDVAGWAEAPMNTPIQEGFKLSTAEGSFAAIEFENGSTVRVGQSSLLEFTQLALAADGSKINRLSMDRGYATFHVAPEGQDIYEVLTPNGTLTPRGKVMFRVDLDSADERVEVFKGFLEVSSSLGSRTLAKDSVLKLVPGADQPEQIAEGITKDDWDRWVQDQESQTEVARNNPTPRAYAGYDSDTLYGWSDLTYYGSWSYMPGFGYGWTPAVDEGWAPYSIGRWSWYPGFGYTWISGDSWGWLPYHYGGWEFVPGFGWAWFPDSFASWYPALVTWYVGPGWIGWMPRSRAGSGGGINPCPYGRSCGRALSVGAFERGQLVRPGTVLSVAVLSGKMTADPGIKPGPNLMLPGRPVSQPAGFANKMAVQRAGSATTTSNATTLAPISGTPSAGFSARYTAPGPKLGIVYDSTEGRYVNSSLPSVSPAPGSSSATRKPDELPIRGVPPAPSRGKNSAPRTASQDRPGAWSNNAASHPIPGASAPHLSGSSSAGMGGGMAGGSHGGGTSSGGGHR
jgi:uncharacterized membrane protein YgcG